MDEHGKGGAHIIMLGGAVAILVIIMVAIMTWGDAMKNNADSADYQQEMKDIQMDDWHLTLVQTKYPKMTGYVSNLETPNDKYDYFIETKGGDVYFAKIKRYVFASSEVETNDTTPIEEGTMLYEQYESSLKRVEQLKEE